MIDETGFTDAVCKLIQKDLDRNNFSSWLWLDNDLQHTLNFKVCESLNKDQFYVQVHGILFAKETVYFSGQQALPVEQLFKAMREIKQQNEQKYRRAILADLIYKIEESLK